MIEKKKFDHLLYISRLEVKKNPDVFIKSFNETLDIIKEIEKVDTTGVEPTVNVLNKTMLTSREDKLQKRNTKDEILKNSAQILMDYYAVPKVIDND